MKVRPRPLTILALVFLSIALGLPLQIMTYYGHTPWEISSILAKMSPINWLIFITAPIAAWTLYRASPWAQIIVPAIALAVVYNNWLVAQVSNVYQPEFVALSTLGFLFCLLPLMNSQCTEIFERPDRRWWLTPFRTKARINTTVRTLGETAKGFSSHTIDLSRGGAFVALHEEAGASIDDIPVGTLCTVTLDLGQNGSLQCKAEVVRSTAARGIYPSGWGLRFLDLTSEQVRLLSPKILGQVSWQKSA